MESGLIIEHLERLAGRGLGPVDVADHARAQRILGLALAACEKTVSLVYEFNLRPRDKHHGPWIDRVRGQLAEAWRLLEAELATPPVEGSQAWLTCAVVWTFAARTLPDIGRCGGLSASCGADGRGRDDAVLPGLLVRLIHRRSGVCDDPCLFRRTFCPLLHHRLRALIVGRVAPILSPGGGRFLPRDSPTSGASP
jgi:hypothetical protein